MCSKICQIFVPSSNPSTRYLLPKFVDFVDGVTDKHTQPKATYKVISAIANRLKDHLFYNCALCSTQSSLLQTKTNISQYRHQLLYSLELTGQDFQLTSSVEQSLWASCGRFERDVQQMIQRLVGLRASGNLPVSYVLAGNLPVTYHQ